MHFSVIAVHCSVLSNTDSQLIVPKSWTCVSSLMHPEASVTVTRDSTTYRTKHATTGNTTLTSSAQSQIPSISDWRRRESDLLSSPVSHTLRGTLPRKYYTVHVHVSIKGAMHATDAYLHVYLSYLLITTIIVMPACIHVLITGM